MIIHEGEELLQLADALIAHPAWQQDLNWNNLCVYFLEWYNGPLG